MTEPPATAPSGIAASQRDVLLATKLHIPASRPDLVPRPRLTERLDESLARGLVLVCAPAGYGKTVLLADWAWRHENPAAWLSLDDGDNDPARFWRHAVAALDRARPGISERVAPLLGPPAPSSFQGLVTALINDLAAEPGTDDALLVLDDYHVIGSQPVHESLAASGEEAAAVATLARSLTLACPRGYVRVFADEGPPMAALLSRLVAAQRTGHAAAGVPLGYLAELQRAFDTGHPASGPGRDTAAVPSIVDPLTSRELQILRMLAAGRSNQAIAGELVVTLNTVKKHVGHVLGKLGAANRTEAVARARELSLIP